ncbi:MAG: diguanylate cyclase [Abitibacteriaceae bacterium]|nr:diguanylate cyclase [Abditibacteriaceae bacterium]
MDTHDSIPTSLDNAASQPGEQADAQQVLRLQQELAQREAALQAVAAQRQSLEQECVQLRQRLQALSQTDVQTGVLSRNYFLALAEREWQRARRLNRSLAIVCVDLDHFKQLGDTYGHSGRDGILRMVAERCRSVLREIDLIGRSGGDEFLILIQEADTLSAVMVAERLRAIISTSPLPVADETVTLTASFGIAITADDTPDINHLIEKATTALDKAKQDGRNRVAVS